MKQWIVTLIAIIVFNSICCEKDARKFSDKVSFLTIKYEMLTAFENYSSRAGNAIMNVARIIERHTIYRWYRFRSWLLDHEFVLGRQSAEFFFHEEQEARDRVIAVMQEELDQLKAKNDKALKKTFSMSWNTIEWIMKLIRPIQWLFRRRKIGQTEIEIEKAKNLQIQTEYFCEKTDFETLAKYCKLALDNEKLLARLKIVSNISEMDKPICQLKYVPLPHYNFESVRKFLRCPIIATAKDGHNSYPTYMYISSTQNPSAYRMRYFLFMSSSLDASLQFREAFSESSHKTQKHIPEVIQTTPNSPPNSTQRPAHELPPAPGSPPRETPMFLGAKSSPPRSPSPERQSESPKRGLFSYFQLRNSGKDIADDSPIEIVTIAINKDSRYIHMRKPKSA